MTDNDTLCVDLRESISYKIVLGKMPALPISHKVASFSCGSFLSLPLGCEDSMNPERECDMSVVFKKAELLLAKLCREKKNETVDEYVN
jgi:hypothetical protein